VKYSLFVKEGKKIKSNPSEELGRMKFGKIGLDNH